GNVHGFIALGMRSTRAAASITRGGGLVRNPVPTFEVRQCARADGVLRNLRLAGHGTSSAIGCCFGHDDERLLTAISARKVHLCTCVGHEYLPPPRCTRGQVAIAAARVQTSNTYPRLRWTRDQIPRRLQYQGRRA